MKHSTLSLAFIMVLALGVGSAANAEIGTTGKVTIGLVAVGTLGYFYYQEVRNALIADVCGKDFSTQKHINCVNEGNAFLGPRMVVYTAIMHPKILLDGFVRWMAPLPNLWNE